MKVGKLSSAAAALRAGHLVVLPTDTIYGIVGVAGDHSAVARLNRAKGRAPTKPFIILISRLADLATFDIQLSPAQRRQLAAWWPGPVSVVLPLPPQPAILKRWRYLHRDTDTLAFRLPRSASLRALLRQTGPLAAPSANPAAAPPATSIAEAREYFGRRVALYLAGKARPSAPSTLVSLSPTGAMTLLRPGATKIKPSKVQ